MKNRIRMIMAVLGVMSAIVAGAYASALSLVRTDPSTEQPLSGRKFSTIEFSTPNEWSFHKYIEKPVNLYNGSVDVTIPLYELNDGEVSLPLTLRYNTSGIRVDEEASWVGLGWNLNVGGYVTCRVVGGYDYNDTLFESNYRDIFYDGQSGYVHTHGTIQVTEDMYDGLVETHPMSMYQRRFGKLEPDVYYFSYPGNSGRYVIDHRDSSVVVLQREQDLRIEHCVAGRYPEDEFAEKVITTPEGVQHHYAEHHATVPAGSLDPVSVSYPLTSTVYPNGSVVSYTYGSYPIVRRGGNAGMTGSLSDGYDAYDIFNDYGQVSHNPYVLNADETYLQEILTPNFRIVFETGTREDVVSSVGSAPGRRLEGISIRTLDGRRTLKRFVLEYSYFGNPDEDDEDRLRLKLEAVKEVDPSDGDICINRYSFSYDEGHALPSKMTYASDYWGYMNSDLDRVLDQTDYFPDLKKLYWDRQDDPDYSRISAYMYPVYDKSHNSDYCGTGMLESVTYPTGGKTMFRYESNSFMGRYIPSVNEQADTVPVVSHTISDRNSSSDRTSVTITADGPREFHVDYRLDRGRNSWETLSGFSSGVRVPFSNSGVHSGALVDLAHDCWERYTDGAGDSYLSGNAVLRSTRSGNTVFQVRFPDELGDQTGSNGNQGMMSAEVWYRDIDPDAIPVERESYGCGMRISEVFHIDRNGTDTLSTTRYSYDDPSTGKTSGILYDRPRYETIVENAVIPFGPAALPPYINHRMFELSGSPSVDNPYGWSTGVGYGCVTETVSGIPGRKEYRFYSNPPVESGQRITVSSPLNGKLTSESYLDSEGHAVRKVEYTYMSEESSHYYGVVLADNQHRGAGLLDFSSQFFAETPYQSGVTMYSPHSIEAYTYALNQNDIWLSSVRETVDGVGKTTDYGFDPVHMLRTSESFTDSDGSTVRTEYRYPSDFDSISVYGTLSGSRHIISPVVETRTSRDGVLVSSVLTTYDGYGNRTGEYHSSIDNANASAHAAFSGSVPNPSLYPFATTEVTLKDRRGNPIAFRLGGIEDEIIVWGYRNRYPIARIKGATAESVESALGCTLLDISDSTEPDLAAIDALRTSLEGVLVETYRYDCLGNVTSMTDASGNVLSYDYDAFGRLSLKSRSSHDGMEPTDRYVYTDISIEHDTFHGRSDHYTDISYYNGIGLPVQTLSVGSGPRGHTVVQPFHYDGALRESRRYLPYELPSASAGEVSDPEVGSLLYWQSQYSSSENAPYTMEVYEEAPTWRPVKQFKPGSSYQSADKHVGTTYGTNSANSVRKLSVNSSGSLVSSGHYAAGLLYRTTTTDEDGRKKETYTNRMGLTVLERQYLNSSSHADTYYVYDRFCNLAMVVTPEGSSRLSSSGTYPSTGSVVANYCYRNQYDSRRRLVLAYHPGGKYDRTLYDNMDRPVITRNNAGGWITIQYDACGRAIGQKRFSAPVPDSAVIANPDSFSPYGSPSVEYIYDSYPSGDSGLSFQTVPGVVSASDVRDFTAGLKVQEKICDISEEGSPDPSSVVRRYYYDHLGRPVQIVERTLWGDILRTSFSYDYLGNVTVREESAEGTTKRQMFTYDARGRLVREATSVNGMATAAVSEVYDVLDRISGTGMGSSVTESYMYNIQGWNTAKTVRKGNMMLFSSTMRYDAPYLGSTPSYDGNVSSWSVSMDGVGGTRTFVLSYDSLGRLTDAPQYTGSSLSDVYTERDISYDRNGNVLALKRYEDGVLSDNLSFTYSGNRRAGYTYDSSGNITVKSGNGYTVAYNRLGLPSSVTPQSAGEGGCTYRYLADGTKVSEVDGNGNGYKYIGTMRFRTSQSGDAFESTAFSKGRIVQETMSSSPAVQYYITDHLGSTRMVLGSDGSVLGRYEYTPFGVGRAVGSSQHLTDYTFSGKERQPFGSVLDFGARLYDPKAAVWNSIDPLAARYYSVSPYAYCNNNPVIFVDPNGMAASTHTDMYGNVVAVFDDGDRGVYRHNFDNDGTELEISRLYSSSNKSAGGDFMGKSLHTFSFAYDDYNNNSMRKTPDDIVIDFNSTQLTDEVEAIIGASPSVFEYARKAAGGGDWDIKAHVENGSLLYGQYASPRDAGNFAAGMFAASQGLFEPVIMYGYGAYNLCGNNIPKTAKYVFINAISPVPISLKMFRYTYLHGEHEISRLGQTMGINYYKHEYKK